MIYHAAVSDACVDVLFVSWNIFHCAIQMEPLMPVKCECFCISVDLGRGETIVSGTELGKQFVMGELCKFYGANVFTSFLNFCRKNTRKGNEIIYSNWVLLIFFSIHNLCVLNGRLNCCNFFTCYLISRIPRGYRLEYM